MKRIVSKSAALLFAVSLGFGTAYAAMGERCGNGNSPAVKCGAGKCGENKNNPKAEHCGSGKCGNGKNMHCGSGKADEGKPKSDAKCGKGKCG